MQKKLDHMPIKYISVLALLALSLSSFCAVGKKVVGSVTMLGPVGGGMGNPVPVGMCSTGYVTEIFGAAGVYVNRIGMICSSGQMLPAMGGGQGDDLLIFIHSGAIKNFSFKSSQGFSGINVRSGAVIDHIQPLNANGGSIVGNAGGSGGGPSSLWCPPGQKIVGFAGRAGMGADAFMVLCSVPGQQGIVPCPPDVKQKTDTALEQMDKTLIDAQAKFASMSNDLKQQVQNVQKTADAQLAQVKQGLQSQLDKAQKDSDQLVAQTTQELQAKVGQKDVAAQLAKVDVAIQNAIQPLVQLSSKQSAQYQQDLKVKIDKVQQLSQESEALLAAIKQAKDLSDAKVQQALQKLQGLL